MSSVAREKMMAWGSHELASHLAPVVLALGATHGRDAEGEPCILHRLDARVIQAIGDFLRRPRGQVRRIERAMFVWVQEARHEDELVRVSKRRKYGRSGRGPHIF